MTNKEMYDKVSVKTSKLTTHAYSTSFSLGIRLLNKRLRNPIYSIYGFVRFADEIVDTFHGFDKTVLLNQYKEDTRKAIHYGISLNPILNSFQAVVNTYKIDHQLIETFLESMQMDLHKHNYDSSEYDLYILGSAEVVGLMCLKVFCDGNEDQYNKLKHSAMKLGSAFQKINFLRDLNADFVELGRVYFPGVDIDRMDDQTKKAIELDIEKDFREGYAGIKQLPDGARYGVYLAYVYYMALFNKIKNMPSRSILKERVRIPDSQKYFLLFGSYLRHSLNLL